MTVSRAELESPEDLQTAFENEKKLAKFKLAVATRIAEVVASGIIASVPGDRKRNLWNLLRKDKPVTERTLLLCSLRKDKDDERCLVAGKYFDFGGLEVAEVLVNEVIDKVCGDRERIIEMPWRPDGLFYEANRTRVPALGIVFSRVEMTVRKDDKITFIVHEVSLG